MKNKFTIEVALFFICMCICIIMSFGYYFKKDKEPKIEYVEVEVIKEVLKEYDDYELKILKINGNKF